MTDAPLPETAFGSTFSGEISSGSSSSGSATFGSHDPFTVAGDAGSSGPHVIVIPDGKFTGICIEGLRRSTARATLVDAEVDKTWVSVEGGDMSSPGTDPSLSDGCVYPMMEPEVADRLVHRLENHPDAYELRLERRDGSAEVVQLTTTTQGEG